MLKWGGLRHVVALALLGCGSEKIGPPEASVPTGSVDAEIIVSAPIPRASLPASADSSGSVVFVSAMPQWAPGSVQALIRNRNGQSANASMLDGGFDPVAVGAVSGDVVTVTLTYANGATDSTELTVRARRPPRVVRTSPAPHRTDVPLNSVIRVVFSSPVDLESARAAIVLTTGSGEIVPGTVEADGVVAVEYVLAAGTLAPETMYHLDVTTEVRDLLGQALAEPVSVEFSTGTISENPPLPPRGFELLVTPVTINLLQGGSGQAEVTIRRGESVGAVALSATSPAGVRVTFSTSVIDTGSTTATISVAVDSATAVGPKIVKISALADGMRAAPRTKTLTVVVAAPTVPPTPPGTITLSINPARITVLQGGQGEVEAVITRGGSFTGQVGVGPANSPVPGVDIPHTGIDSTSSTTTLSVYVGATVPPGNRVVVIEAYSYGIKTATARLTVEIVAPSGTVSLVPDPDPIVVAVGSPAVTSTIAINRTGAFAGPVELTVQEYPYMDGRSWPAGVTASWSPRIATGASSTLSISVAAGAVNGAYPLLIIGRGTGIIEAYATVMVAITGGSPGFFTFDPATVTVTAGGPSATSVLARDPTTRLFGRLMLSVSAPAGFTVSPASLYMASPTTTLTVEADATVAPGTYYLTVTGNVQAVEPSGQHWHAVLPVVVSAAPALRR